MVPRAGLEPARPYGQRILSPLRLPIPPPGQARNGAKQTVGDGGIQGGKPKLAILDRILHVHSHNDPDSSDSVTSDPWPATADKAKSRRAAKAFRLLPL